MVDALRGHPDVAVEPDGADGDRRPLARARRESPTACCGGSATSPQVRADGRVTRACAADALALFEVDEQGLDKLDLAILTMLVEKFRGGPVGLSTLAAAVGEEPDTIEDVYEPYLMQLGFLKRTPRGRVATPDGVPAPGSSAGRRSRRSSESSRVR